MIKRQEMFTEPEAVAAWDGFFAGIDTMCRSLASDQRRELVLELQDHLYESYTHQVGNSEAERIESAIDRIGNPDDFVRPMVADHLLATATRTLNPRSIFLGLMFNMSRGVRAVFVSTLFGIGYLLSLAFLLVAIGKPFNPEGTGLFANPGGTYTLGIFDSRPEGASELLGFWVIPLCVVMSVAIYWALTRLLRRLRSGKVGTRRI